MQQESKINEFAYASLSFPTIKNLFQAGVHFGHETRRWNPKMEQYIYTSRKGIHIIDLEQTQKMLAESMKALVEIASNGEVLLVGSKSQASDIIRDAAINSGAHFVNKRWVGGLLTNYNQVRKSLNRLRELETLFEKGVEGRTKYEINLMKKEWEKLNRLYAGVKMMEKKPAAVVLVDVKYERCALKEAIKLKIPVIAIVDTNSDTEGVTYPIPANDDAISSIKLIMNSLADAIRLGNKGNGVHHLLKDYSKVEVQIIKKDEYEELSLPTTLTSTVTSGEKKIVKVHKPIAKRSTQISKGILEAIQNKKEMDARPMKKKKTDSKKEVRSLKQESKSLVKSSKKKLDKKTAKK